ncbi:L,D-transpeptidase family protein [Nocardia sp. CA2R105]|nr:L,D-transpeptidase family protein [Nocardia coffeae]
MSQTGDPDHTGGSHPAQEPNTSDIPVAANTGIGEDEQNTVTESTPGEPTDATPPTGKDSRPGTPPAASDASENTSAASGAASEDAAAQDDTDKTSDTGTGRPAADADSEAATAAIPNTAEAATTAIPAATPGPTTDAPTTVLPSSTPIPPPTKVGAAAPGTSVPGPGRATWLLIGAAVAIVVIAVGAVFLGRSATDHGGSGGSGSEKTTPAVPAAAISVPDTANPINPSVPITVSASGGRLTSVSATTPDGKPLAGTLSPDGLTWTNTDSLAFSSAYAITADAVNSAGAHTKQNFTVNTISTDNVSTAYANVVPAPDVVADTGIGVGQPMVFQFTKPVTNKAEVQKHLHVSVTPAQPGAWYWVDDKDVHYRGPNYWLPGTKIHIEADVVGLDLGNGVLGAENNSADYTVHDSWVAKADGSTDQLTIFQNGKQVNQMPMSLGSPGFPSHEGPHVISDKQPSIVMDSCTYGTCAGQPGYYKETVALDERISNDGEFVHSAPWSVGQQGSSNVSHGCVNLAPDNAQWFYNHFGIGDVVEITNSGGPTLPVWDTYGDWEVPWQTWQAGNANS